MDDWDECWEPGYDPGPDPHDEGWPSGTCDECGAEDEPVSPNGLCYECEQDAREDTRQWDDDDPIDGVGFADPGGRSALRAATRDNPRNLPCPTCGTENVLTPADRARGYQCDRCADACERGVDW